MYVCAGMVVAGAVRSACVRGGETGSVVDLDLSWTWNLSDGWMDGWWCNEDHKSASIKQQYPVR